MNRMLRLALGLFSLLLLARAETNVPAAVQSYLVTNAALFPSLPLPANAVIFRNGLLQTPSVDYNVFGGTFRFRAGKLSNGDRVSVIPGSGVFSMQRTCAAGNLYFAYESDPKDGNWLFGCDAKDGWAQLLNVGPGLRVKDGLIDIHPDVVPRKDLANTFSDLQTLLNGLSLSTPTPRGECTSGRRGTFWFLNNGDAKDDLSVCLFNGTALAWVSIF